MGGGFFGKLFIKVSPTIKSVKPTTDILGSVKKTKIDASLKNFRNIKNLNEKKAQGKKMMQEAQKELRRAADTKRATVINKKYYSRSVPADKTDLRNEQSAKAFKIAKGKDLEKKAKGGRIGRRFGGDTMKRKTNVEKIKETFAPKKKVPSKFKGFSKLPENVQQKINSKLAKKV